MECHRWVGLEECHRWVEPVECHLWAEPGLGLELEVCLPESHQVWSKWHNK